MNLKARSNAMGNASTSRFISYGLVFLMIVCVIMAIRSLLQSALPHWPIDIIAGVMLLVVLDRLSTYPFFKSLTPLTSEWALTFAAQWIVFVIFIRLLLSYAKGFNAFVTDMRLFTQGDLENFLSPEFILTLLLAVLAWYLPTQFLELLDEIGLDQALALRTASLPIQGEAVPIQQRLVNSVFSVGILLVILAALARIDFSALFTSIGSSVALRTDFAVGEAGVFLYFLLGLALLAQGRLMSLQTRWNVQRIPISSDNFARRWGLYSLLFLALVILAVGLLPTGDSLGIFSLLRTLLDFILGVLLFLGMLILSIFSLLISLPYWLLNPFSPAPVYTPPAFTPPPADVPMSTVSSPLWILIRSILLWGALILIIVFSLMRFLGQHESLLATLRKAPVVSWLIYVWEWLRKSADRTRAGLTRVLTDGWQNMVTRFERGRLLPRPDLISLRSLDPRRRVYFFYHAMLRHSDKQGLTRKLSQTPSEYAATLERGVPDASEDIDALTGAFIEARYSRHEVDAGKADFVKATWERIRRALRSKFDGERSEKK